MAKAKKEEPKEVLILPLMNEIIMLAQETVHDVEKFDGNVRGANAAGARIRNQMQLIKQQAQLIRQSVQEVKNNRKA